VSTFARIAVRQSLLTLDAAIGCAVVVAACAFLAVSADGLHWALIPLGLCGALTAPTLVRWLRGVSDAFDPKAVVTVLVFHNTFVAPVLHLLWDWYTPLVRVPHDTWGWFGRLAVVNAIALVCLELAYRSTVAIRPPALRPLRRVRAGRLAMALGLGGFIAVLAQLQLLRHFGGASGLIDAYEARGQEFSGMGTFLMLAWPFPLIALLETLLLVSRRRRRRPSGRLIAALLAAFAVLHLAWAGLHGSRLSMLGGIFLAAGLCHFLVRRFSTRAVLVGVSAALVFCFVYSFYKGAGRVGIATALSGTEGLARAQQQTGRDVGWLLLGDLGRADVQMEVLWTMYDANPEYRPKLGATYVGAAIFIPRGLWPSRPRGPQEAYTELRDGQIGTREGDAPNSRVFGLTGETLLNFGWMGVPVAHALFGVLIGLVRRGIDSLRPGDARFLVVPFAILLVTALYLLDLSEVVFMFLQDCALLAVCAVVAFWRPRRSIARPARIAVPAWRSA
jgi:hypothetical protein